MQTLQELQAYSGERINAISRITPKDIRLDLDEQFAVIFFDGSTTKNHIKHFSICPKFVALQVLEIMQKTHRNKAFPNYQQLWKKITTFAKDEFNVRYTSHYLRARFETIADDTGISMNKVAYLMGEKCRDGHLPDIYILRNTQKFIFAYYQFLSEKLRLTQDLTYSKLNKTAEQLN